MTNELTLENCKGYATEANLRKALTRYGLDNYTSGEEVACRYIVCKKPDGKWTAVFLVMEFFRNNNTGGYIGFASQRGFMSV